MDKLMVEVPCFTNTISIVRMISRKDGISNQSQLNRY